MKRTGNTLSGFKNNVKFLILFEEGHSGGGAGGPGTVGYKSRARIIFTKATNNRFELEKETYNEYLKSNNIINCKKNFNQLYELGITKVISSGDSVEAIISPVRLGKNIDANILERVVFNLSEIVNEFNAVPLTSLSSPL